MIAVGLRIRCSILTTSVPSSFVQDRDKFHNDILNPVIIHHHGKADRVIDKLRHANGSVTTAQLRLKMQKVWNLWKRLSNVVDDQQLHVKL